MSIFIILFGVFLTALGLTGVIKKFGSILSLIDTPVDRSAHSTPMPSGGGVAIVVLFLIFAYLVYINGSVTRNEYLAILGALVIAAIGLADDVSSLSLRHRLTLQFIVATWAVYWLGGVPDIDFFFFKLSSPSFLALLGIFAIVWLSNLYNFMDGIDAIAGAELIFVNAMTLIFVINSENSIVGFLSAVLAAATAGFLVWNWPPAKIFMGDVGSSFIGYTLGVFALLSMHHGNMTVWTWFILLGVFVVDATLTLLVRALHGNIWYESHSSHAYQNAARYYKSHGKVTITVSMVNIFWLAPWAWLSVRYPETGFYLCLFALLPIALLAIKFKAGKPA